MSYQNKIHGIDCDAYGEAYAGALIRNATAQPSDLPGLQADRTYSPLPAFRKEEVLQAIKRAARQTLVMHGYPPETINRILG